jgi:hypothetical protein
MLGSVPPTPPTLTGVGAAVQVVRDYYAAVSAHDYRRAYAIWKRGRTYRAFVDGYRHTRSVRVRFLPPFEAEGAAGSVYTEVKVRVDAQLTTGRLQHFAGSYTLRRVNDVDGSTAAQRRWHIESAKLTPAT